MPLLLELPYAPALPWMALARKSDLLVLEAHENYQKGSYRNRCHIAGPQRLQRLSIPLEKGKHQRTPITEVGISYDQPWLHQHWQALQTAYGRSPFFPFYAPTLAPLYDRPPATLFAFNEQLLRWLFEQLGWPAEWSYSSDFERWHQPVVNARDWVHPKRALPDQLHWRPLDYHQVFQETAGFLPNLSVLDLLFNTGSEAGYLLDQAAQQLPNLDKGDTL